MPRPQRPPPLPTARLRPCKSRSWRRFNHGTLFNITYKGTFTLVARSDFANLAADDFLVEYQATMNNSSIQLTAKATQDNLATSVAYSGNVATVSGDTDRNSALDLVFNSTWTELTGL
jgi:hypothetical protein